MSKKQATAKLKPKQEEKAKKPVAGKTATGKGKI